MTDVHVDQNVTIAAGRTLEHIGDVRATSSTPKAGGSTG